MKIANSNKGIVREAREEIVGSFGVVTNENSLIQEVPGVLVGIEF